MRVKRLFICLLAASAWARAEPEPALASAPAAEVLPASETLGVRQPESVPYREVLGWLDAFDQHRQLAPKASLQFDLRPPKGQTLPEGLVLKIVGESKVEALPVSREGRVTLPRIAELAGDDEAVVRSNQKKGSYRWRPVVRTPGLADNALRLGDLRLMCRVVWPMAKPHLPWVARLGLSAIGGICTKNLPLFMPAPNAFASVTLLAGERKENLAAERLKLAEMKYWPPIADASWPDDTLLIFNAADK